MILPLSVKNQSVESSGITKDYREALCEFVWNGFEANATEVKVSYTLNDLQNIDTVIVSDNGDGVNYEGIEDTFGAFLASQKNTLSLKVKSKANKGKGRFSFAAFSTIAEFKTRYNDNGIVKEYKITLTNDNKESLEYDDFPQVIPTNRGTGTTVTFYNTFGISTEDLSSDTLDEYLLSEFAWYLYLNKHKNIKLYLNDVELDYNKHINNELSETVSRDVCGKLFDINNPNNKYQYSNYTSNNSFFFHGQYSFPKFQSIYI